MAGEYNRSFITLKQERGDYSFNGREAIGSAIIERRGNNGKVSITIYNIKPRVLYKIYLIHSKDGRALGVNAGSLNVDERGCGQLKQDFHGANVFGCGISIEEFNVVAVIVPKGNELIVPLAGYRSEMVMWKNNFIDYTKKNTSKTDPQRESEKKPERVSPEPPDYKEEKLSEEAAAEQQAEALPEAVVEQQAEALLEAVVEQQAETLLEAVVEQQAETLLEAVVEQQAEALLEAVVEQQAEALPEAVVEQQTEALLEAVVEQQAETLPEAVFEQQAEALPEAVVEQQAEALPEAMIEQQAADPPVAVEEQQAETSIEIRVKQQSEIPVELLAEHRAETYTAQQPDEAPDIHMEFKAMAEKFNKELKELIHYTFLTEEELAAIHEKYENKESVETKDYKPKTELELIFTQYAPMTPFQHQNKDVTWIRISPAELCLLPFDFYSYQRNPFILSAYRKYQHLLLGCAGGKLGESPEYILGIPEQYRADYRLAALKMGFCQFKCCEDVKAKDGDYGYWLMKIEAK